MLVRHAIGGIVMSNIRRVCGRSSAIVAALAAYFQLFFVTPALADAPAFVRIEAQFNFLTGEPNSWTSTGAFVDSGFIGVGETVETFSPGTFKRAKVVGPIVSHSDGSAIVWKFTKVWSFTSETTLVQHGQWHIVEGTGRYAGIKGQGEVEGDLDINTGVINDVFTGWVQLP